jgi:peptidoglycan/LPS O-acetylase OafA/YrhL
MEGRDWRTVVLIAVSCLAAAAVLYFAVERPMLQLRDRRAGRNAASVDVEARAEPAL